LASAASYSFVLTGEVVVDRGRRPIPADTATSWDAAGGEEATTSEDRDGVVDDVITTVGPEAVLLALCHHTTFRSKRTVAIIVSRQRSSWAVATHRRRDVTESAGLQPLLDRIRRRSRSAAAVESAGGGTPRGRRDRRGHRCVDGHPGRRAGVRDLGVVGFGGARGSTAGSREHYEQLVASGKNRLEYHLSRVVVDADAVVTDGEFRFAYRGDDVETATAGVDVDAWYLVAYQCLVVWPIAADGRIAGEEIYTGERPRASCVRSDPASCLTLGPVMSKGPQRRTLPGHVSGDVIGVGIIGLSAGGGWARPKSRARHRGHARTEAARRVREPCRVNRRGGSLRYGVVGRGVTWGAGRRATMSTWSSSRSTPRTTRISLARCWRPGRRLLCEWPLGASLRKRDRWPLQRRWPKCRPSSVYRPAPRQLCAICAIWLSDGFVGQVLSTSVIASGRAWGESFKSRQAYTMDPNAGVVDADHPWSGHTLDVMAMVLGELSDVCAVVASARLAQSGTGDGTVGRHDSRGSGRGRGPPALRRGPLACLPRRPSRDARTSTGRSWGHAASSSSRPTPVICRSRICGFRGVEARPRTLWRCPCPLTTHRVAALDGRTAIRHTTWPMPIRMSWRHCAEPGVLLISRTQCTARAR